MTKQKISGYIMAGIGLAMILISAMSYIFNWDLTSPAFSIMGMVFFVVGSRIVRDNKRNLP